MELDNQANLIREFMLRISPEIVRASIQGGTPGDCAQTTLEWSMHLAGAFANFIDEAYRPPQKDTTKAQFETYQQMQREAAPTGTGL